MGTDGQLRLARVDELDAVVGIDDEATTLYAEAGLELELGPEHPFVLEERARWRAAIERGLLWLVLDDQGAPAAFMALGFVDGLPYLDQLSVRPDRMKRGVGRELVTRAQAWALETGHRELWLTTYGHLAWNRPFYERMGFACVPEERCGPGIVAILDSQRRWLPAPEHRVAMVWRP